MEVFDIKERIDFNLVKKIFSNATNGLLFLKALGLNPISTQKKATDIFNQIVLHWNYEKSRPIIREIFQNTLKFQRGLEGAKNIEILLYEWKNLGLGKVEWPFSQGAFDNFVQGINSQLLNRQIKDEKVKEAALKYRRIKEINTERNDFLETLIFLKNDNIIPILSHSRGIDFFINGISYDQKVSRSVTNEFKRDFGQNYKEIALLNPHTVAEYLYAYQDEGRFGANPRLFIVYEEVSPVRTEHIIHQINLNTPLDITFTYKHKDIGERTYKTQAFVILLSE